MAYDEQQYEEQKDDSPFKKRQEQIDEVNWVGSGLPCKPVTGHERESEG